MKVSTQQFPGRVRLRLPQLKGAPFLAAQVAASVRQVGGVVTAETSQATGSLLVVYDVGGPDELTFWRELQHALAQHGLSPRNDAPVRDARAGTPYAAAHVAGKVTEKFVETLVGKLAERGALALVAALL
jgi:hypothetical protein